MAETKREIERKYESDDSGLPDLTGIGGVAAVLDKGLVELDATYYDTADQRLAAASVTLRRRTGGSDAGWHLKLPVAPGVRDEIRAPLSDTLPEELAALVRSRVWEAQPVPLVRLRSARDVRHLVDADGALLAEASVDAVTAERLTGAGGTVQWTEIEVELADGETRPSSTRWRNAWPGRAYGRPPRRPNWPAPSNSPGACAARPPPAPSRSPRVTTSSPISGPSGTPWSPSTPPYDSTRPTRCTGCGSPPAAPAAPCAPSVPSWTAPSPSPSPPS